MRSESRTKATELAVELLRGSLPEPMITRALAGPAQSNPSEPSYAQSADVLAVRVGELVRKVSAEIEKHIC